MVTPATDRVSNDDVNSNGNGNGNGNGGPRFTELLRGATLQGDPATLNAARCIKLGRALGTLTRRRTAGGGRQRVVIARGDDGNTVAVRDGLVSGLLLCGHDVKDIGVAPSDVFTFALRHLDAAAGAVIADGDALSIMFFMGGRPLVGEGLQQLGALADGEDFSAGEGTLELVDVRRAFRARKLADSQEGEPA